MALSSTTLGTDVAASDVSIKLASVSGIVPGTLLYVDREQIRVTSLGASPYVNVLRGQNSTATTTHASSSTVYLGTGEDFPMQDPLGTTIAGSSPNPDFNVPAGTKYQPTASNGWVREINYAILGTPTITTPAITGGTVAGAAISTPTYTVNTYSADGAITVASQVALLTKTSAGAYTLAAPGTAGIGVVLTFTTGTDFAHVVTFTALWDGTSTVNTTWTAAAVQGSSLTVVGVSATKWNVVNFNLGTIAP